MSNFGSEERAIHAALPEQWKITWGSRVIRMFGTDLVIFGHIYTEHEFKHLDNDPEAASGDELQAELRQIRAAHMRGHRYGRFFSENEPRGEYGSAHIVSLWEITTAEFEQARERSWQVWPDLAMRVLGDVQASLNRERSR